MSCRRALEIDLAAMMAGEAAPELQEFRSHYPRCRECSAEVQAWSAVHGLLTATATDAHPNPKKLLWFVDRPQSLSTADRDLIKSHVADCRSCRDEMATLKGLDLHALTRPLAGMPATAAPPQRPAAAPAAPAPWWHTLGWPRLAFVVVAMGLVPLLTSRFGPPPPPATDAPASQVAVSGGAAPGEESGKADAVRQDAPAPAEPQTAKPERSPSLGMTAKAKKEIAPPVAASGQTTAAAKAAPGADKPTRYENRVRPEQPAPPPPAAEPDDAAADDGFRSLGSHQSGSAGLVHESARKGAARRRALIDAESRDEEADRDGTPQAAPTPPGSDVAPRVVRLQRAGTVHVAAADGAPLTIVTPAHPPGPADSDADVRIVDAGQRRELRQQGTVAGGALSTTVAGGWLTPGDYQVEVRVRGVLTIYRLTVDR